MFKKMGIFEVTVGKVELVDGGEVLVVGVELSGSN